MSVHVSSWAWRQMISDSGTKLVLLKLADCSNDEGISWPSQKLLAEQCGMKERNLRYKLTALEELGLLTVEERRRGNGSKTSNYYRLASGTPLPLDNRHSIAGLERHSTAGPEPSDEPSVNLGASRERDVVWDEIAAELGEPTNKQTRAKRNAAVKLIKESLYTSLGGDQGEHDPEEYGLEVRRRIRRYRALFPNAPVTDMGLANQWDALGWERGLGPRVVREEVDYGPELTPEEIEENKRRVAALTETIANAHANDKPKDMQLTVDGDEEPHEAVVAKTTERK